MALHQAAIHFDISRQDCGLNGRAHCDGFVRVDVLARFIAKNSFAFF